LLTAEEMRKQLNKNLFQLEDLDKIAIKDTKTVPAPKPAVEVKEEAPPEEAVQEESEPLPPLEAELSELLKVKGIVLISIADRQGRVVSKVMKEGGFSGDLQAVLSDIQSDLEKLQAPAQFNYWLIEYSQGILLLHTLNHDYLLITQGLLGTNFGALRYSIEHKRKTLEQLLAGAGS